MTCYLLTGGAGFIGSNLVRYILDKGYGVIVLDNFSTGKRENLVDVLDKITLLEGDIRSASDVKKALEGCSGVFHLGALGSVPRSIANPVASHDNNVNGTINVLECMRKAGVKRIVFSASSSAYGNQKVSPKVETMPVLPISPYAASKAACEGYMQAYAAVFGIEAITLRYFNVFGPRQDPNSVYAAVIPIFVSTLLKGKQPTINGDGEHSRDFSFVENVCYANWLGMNVEAKKCDGRPINIACNRQTSLNQIYKKLQELLKTDIEPIYGPERKGDVKHSLADITRAKEVLGYEPLVYFEEGLERAIDWYKENL